MAAAAAAATLRDSTRCRQDPSASPPSVFVLAQVHGTHREPLRSPSSCFIAHTGRRVKPVSRGRAAFAGPVFAELTTAPAPDSVRTLEDFCFSNDRILTARNPIDRDSGAGNGGGGGGEPADLSRLEAIRDNIVELGKEGEEVQALPAAMAGSVVRRPWVVLTTVWPESTRASLCYFPPPTGNFSLTPLPGVR